MTQIHIPSFKKDNVAESYSEVLLVRGHMGPSTGERRFSTDSLTCPRYLPFLAVRVTNLYNMLPVRTAGQLEVLLLVIRYAKEAQLVAMLGSFFAGLDDWIKVGNLSFLGTTMLRSCLLHVLWHGRYSEVMSCASFSSFCLSLPFLLSAVPSARHFRYNFSMFAACLWSRPDVIQSKMTSAASQLLGYPQRRVPFTV